MLMDIGLLVILWASRRKTLASLSGHLSQKTPARQRVPAMMYIKNIVIGAGLSCVLLSAPILVHAANVVETKTFKNSVPVGITPRISRLPPTDIRLRRVPTKFPLRQYRWQ